MGGHVDLIEVSPCLHAARSAPQEVFVLTLCVFFSLLAINIKVPLLWESAHARNHKSSMPCHLLCVSHFDRMVVCGQFPIDAMAFVPSYYRPLV
jgi:hypothetical protein